MNNRQRRILAKQLGQALRLKKRVISIPLTSAMLEIEATHLERLEREGLFPDQVCRADGSCGYDLGEIYTWLKEISNAPR